ncbi:MAG: EAL domain-containing protein, partial [Azoarcus sp.]|nr:EAL domain-containing protein [Azoarcus sp.]
MHSPFPFRGVSIRIKLLAAGIIVQVMVLALLLANCARLMDIAANASLETLIGQNERMLHRMVTAYLDEPDFASLPDTLKELLAGNRGNGLVYVHLADSSGKALLHAGMPEIEASLPPPDVGIGRGDVSRLLDRPLIHVRRPQLLDHDEVGFLQFGVSTTTTVAARQAIIRQSALIALGGIAATFVLMSAIGYLLTSRLTRLVAGSQALTDGKLEHRLPDEGDDELARLARHFNIMASALQLRIGELQRSTARLRASEERYALAIRGANDGLWDWDIVGDRGHFSPRFCEMLGLAVDTSVSDISPLEMPTTLFPSRLHPDETAIYRERLIEHLKGISSQFMLEHRVRHEDGSYRWIMTRGVAQRDVHGRAVRMAGSISDIHLRKRAEQQLLHDALHDDLTGLPNQALFIEHLRQALAQRGRGEEGRHFAVLAVNLERFHLINDSYGHATGDRLLRQVADYFSSSLRAGDIVARLGGDQFAILLQGVSSVTEATKVADSLVNLPDCVTLGARQVLHVKCRIGLAMSDSDTDAETLLRDADNALQMARKGECSPVEIFQASMHASALTTLRLETDLRNALANERLSVHYQPIVHLHNCEIASFEALVRWRHPTQGMIPPVRFIPVAESLGLIHDLGLFVLRRTCRDILEWRGQTGTEPPPVSVNLSASQLSRPDLASELLGIIAGYGLAPGRLRFEVTESLLARAADPGVATLQRLREAGAAVLIDDFGTGYSALSYLHTIPCDTVKLDGSFVGAITRDARLRAIVRYSIGLSHDLGMSVVAECIESEDQSQMLR